MNPIKRLPVLSILLALSACTSSEAPGAKSGPSGPGVGNGTPGSQGEAPLQTLRQFVSQFTARPENTDPQVTVQHLLIAFAGSGVPGTTRSKEAAEQLTAELWAKIQAGEDFDALVKQYTNDSYPGRYKMSLQGGGQPGTYPRNGMVPAFGDTGWRLAVGEFGVAAFDPKKSPYGWHIVKRVE